MLVSDPSPITTLTITFLPSLFISNHSCLAPSYFILHHCLHQPSTLLTSSFALTSTQPVYSTPCLPHPFFFYQPSSLNPQPLCSSFVPISFTPHLHLLLPTSLHPFDLLFLPWVASHWSLSVSHRTFCLSPTVTHLHYFSINDLMVIVVA